MPLLRSKKSIQVAGAIGKLLPRDMRMELDGMAQAKRLAGGSGAKEPVKGSE